jgi:multisubunit Na+/H+ antiporter MnhB subunit
MSGPWHDPEPDEAVRRILKPTAPVVRPERSTWRDPPRLLIVVGTVVAVVASPLPWLERVPDIPPRTLTGWSGFFDGFLIAFVALVLTWMVLHRDASRARLSILRWLPIILGGVLIVLMVSAVRNMETQISNWAIEGATGEYQPWIAVCLVGAGLVAVGAFWFGARRLRER